MSVFDKFPPSQKEVQYVAGLRRNPQFRAECDEAVKDFLENEIYYSKDELRLLQKDLPELYGNPLRSPEVLRAFIDYSPSAQIIASRWGLLDSWHYDSPNFPLTKDLYAAYPKRLKEVKNTVEGGYDFRHNPKKYYVDDDGMVQMMIDPKAPPNVILARVNYYLTRGKKPRRRGMDMSDTEKIFKIFDMHEGGKKPWQISQELFPQVIGQDPAIDKEAKRILKNVIDALKKAKKVIGSIKPIE